MNTNKTNNAINVLKSVEIPKKGTKYVIIKIGNGEPQTWFASVIYKNTSTMVKLQMCFLLLYFCLLIIITKAIIKANAMIVTDIKPANSNFIISNKVVSIIRLTSFM